MAAWVLILFYFSSGAPALAMHDFADERACQAARGAAEEAGRQMSGYPQVRGVCTPKGGHTTPTER